MRYLLLICGLSVNIATVLAEGVVVESAYIREAPPGQQVTAAFMRLHNRGEQDCVLTGVATPVAGSAEIHDHSHENGVVRMRPVRGIALPAGVSLELKPGGYHAMLFGVTEKLSDSERYPLTIYFDGCQPVHTDAEVRSLLR